MALVNEYQSIKQGITQFYLPPTRSSTSGLSHTCLYPQPQSITTRWLVLISCPTEGRRLSWRLSCLRWLGEILRWFAHPKMVIHPSTNRVRQSNCVQAPKDITATPNRHYYYYYHCYHGCCCRLSCFSLTISVLFESYFFSALTLLVGCQVEYAPHTTPQPFYAPFSGTTRVSQCQKRSSGLYGARED